MRSVNLALALVSLATLVLWFSMDWQVEAPDWRGKAYGFSYNPSRLYTRQQGEVVPDRHLRDCEDLRELGDRDGLALVEELEHAARPLVRRRGCARTVSNQVVQWAPPSRVSKAENLRILSKEVKTAFENRSFETTTRSTSPLKGSVAAILRYAP